MNYIERLFKEDYLVSKIRSRLPELFQIAAIESSRAGKIGMEVGTIRERIIVALLIHVFGEKNVQTEIPATESEIDVRLSDNPISIKTFTGKSFVSVKLIWTVDPKKAIEFQESYIPSCDMLLIQANWGGDGNMYWFSKNSQLEILQKIGKERYIKLPKPGTNPRGIEISSESLELLSKHKDTMVISIPWKKKDIQYNTFDRWVDLWEKE